VLARGGELSPPLVLEISLQTPAFMSAFQLTAQQVIGDADVDLALKLTAPMFGLSKDIVIKIVHIDLPMMARMAETNPESFKRMYPSHRPRFRSRHKPSINACCRIRASSVFGSGTSSCQSSARSPASISRREGSRS
jgi:hypothetical protein